ncbi:MAG: S-layer homology domain-containing protein [Ruminococcaceae bacterium]|nr:S-layer homology domain-containing protein [Oscillospiraceae bacterium]
MKNLKKVLALVVALTMVLGTVGFAAYTDVAEDAGEYTAVSTLSSLGILTGYEDGTFKPDGDITRAEFSAVVCRALGAKVSGTAATPFTDVAADHWASGYIAYVAGQKIVNGMGDGTFAPDANVTVEQAVKMLVVALGFEPMAAQRGGYPTGYMVVANTYGITEGIAAAQTANASRAIVSQLVYNALDVPMMEQTGFGTQIEYQIQDGTNGKDYKTLLTNLDVAKLDGVVIGTPIIAYGDTNPATTDINKVAYRFYEVYENEYFESKLNSDNVGEMEFEVAEGVDAAAYFGIASTIYVYELAKNKYEIIAIMPGEDSTIMEFGVEDLDEVSASAIEYYTSANKYDTKTLRLDSPDVYYNYAQTTIQDLIDLVDTIADVEITVIENTGDNKFDMIIMKEYAYARVEEVEADRDRFTTSDASTFAFDFDDEETPVSIVDKNGDAITLADFAEDDVIAYVFGGVNTRNYDWIEIINLGQNAVTGTVNEEKGTEAVYVDGTEYGLYEAGVAALGDEGTFYLTRTGKIFDSEKDASVSGNYAYILATALSADGGFSKAWQVKMLTKEGEVVTYSVRDGFAVNTTTQIDEDAADAPILSDLDVNAADPSEINEDITKRIVTYKLDSKGKIREINSVDSDAFGKAAGAATGKEYDADSQYLGAELEDDTVIFNISNPTESGVYTATISTLVNENEYSGYYITNDKDEVDCLVITDGGSQIDVLQDLAIISSVTDITVDEGATDAKKVRYYVSGEEEEKEITVVDDEEVSIPQWFKAGVDAYASLSVGDAIMFTDDGNGTAAAYTIVFDAIFGDATKAYDENETATAAITAEDEDVTFITGYIDDIAKANGGKAIVLADGTRFTVKNTANAYTLYNKTANKARVYVGSWDAVETIDKVGTNNNGTKDDTSDDFEEATYFVAKKFNNTIKDFITYSERIAIGEY